MKFFDAGQDFFQAYGVGVPHGAAAMGGEAVAVQVDDVDVGSAESVAFFENARALVDKGIEAAVRDFVGGDLMLRSAGFGDPLFDEGVYFGIGRGSAILVVFVPAAAGFLAETAEFAEFIFGERLADTWLFEMAIFLADAPADIKAGEVSGGERTHGEAEVGERFVDGWDAGAFFNEELRFAAIGAEHAIAHEAAAVSNEHANFAKRFRKIHARGDDFFGSGFTADNFEQAHDVGGTEEM